MASPPSLSRSGRVRKPKVFYDPSVEDTKRRSMPNMETNKTKRSAKDAALDTPPEQPELKKPDEILIQEKEKPKRVPPAASITKRRRQTICAPTFLAIDSGNGCIVCGRSDIRKGRFVNCIDCIKRGHFTCLRNEKLFKTADQELNWQCPACKICEHCRNYKSNEQLYKCIICLNSYHLHCSSKIAPLAKNVVKKKFTCGVCMKGATTVKPTIKTFVKPVELTARSLLPNRKSDGFPGFAHEDTAKVEQKLNVPAQETKSNSDPSDHVSSGLIMAIKMKPSDYNSYQNAYMRHVLKKEKKSPTPEREAIRTERYAGKANGEENNVTKIMVRKDLIQPMNFKKNVEKPKDDDNVDDNDDDDNIDIKYDTKSVITPHESVPDVKKWDCDEVYTYFRAKAPEYAQLLKDNQIDGDALLLIKRDDVVNRFSLKLGQALRLYTQIVQLQYKNNNPILAWNEF